MRDGLRAFKGKTMRGLSRCTIATAVAIAIFGVIGPSANAQAAMRIDLPEQSLAESLKAVANQTNTNVLFDLKAVEGIKAPAISDELTPQEAVKQLLLGTGLTAEEVNEHTIVLTPAGKIAALSGSGKRIRLAEADSSTPSESSEGVKLEEVIVTAQKREERLQDVPIPVTAIDASSLVNSNQSRLQDYFNKVPGLTLTTINFGAPLVSIRGVKLDAYEVSTVGVLVDGIPVTLTAGEGSQTAPDIDPSSLQRVEVLRGPQGTLYGASSLGGLINYVTVEPSMDRVSGRLAAGTTSVSHGDSLGYSVRGSVNVPLNDQLAVRASGFTRRDPGYVDNFYLGEPGLKAKDVNESDAYGGHLTLLWRPSETFSLKLSALAQRFSSDGADYSIIDSSFGDLQQAFLRGTGTMTRESQAYSATLNAKLGPGELTVASGFGTNPFKSNYDLSPQLGFLGPIVFPGFFSEGDAVGVPQINNTNTLDKFTQEVRYSGSMGKRWEYMLAGFYTREKFSIFAPALMINPITRESAGVEFLQQERQELKEYAAFANFTFKLSEQFDIQVGGRQSQYRHDIQQYLGGVVFCPAPFGDPACEPYASGELLVPNVLSELKDDAFTYHLTPRFRISPDLMVYGRLATGYRIGAGTDNPPPTAICVQYNLPCKTDPDTTQNYEIGAKGNLFAGKLSFDASIYYIDWKDIPLGVQVFPDNPNIVYGTNGGRATSKGIELALQSRPVGGLTLDGWLAWNNAYLADVAPGVLFSAVGRDRLPYSSRFSGHFSAEQEFPVGDRMTAFLGASVTYAGRRFGGFRSTFEAAQGRQIFPAYTQTDARAGVRYDDWAVNLFINNIADKRAAIQGGMGSTLGANYFTFIRPRTMGLSVERSF